MKKITLLLIIYMPLLSGAQNLGIKFENELSWEQIKKKAAAEKKYIFLDCYASWCLPCKRMDKEIYTNDSIGKLINGNFISVKVQMDTSKNDDERVRGWYTDAHDIKKEYSITSFPTFLFFSYDTEPVHIDIGYKDVQSLYSLSSDALDPRKQYFSLLRSYKQNEMDYSAMGNLAMIANRIGDEEMAIMISKDYKIKYLDNADDSVLFKKENIEFMSTFPELLNSKDKMFALLYNHSDRIDRTMEYKGFADFYIRRVITQEEIEGKIWNNGKPVTNNPNWERIKKSIAKKYSSDYADKLVPEAQIRFFRHVQNWRKYSEFIEVKLMNNPPKHNGKSWGWLGDAAELNNIAFDVFQFCKSKKVLKKALSWSDLALQLEEGSNYPYQPNHLDTKANILYKLRKVKEAVAVEELAIELDAANAQKEGKEKGVYSDILKKALEKMRKGEPTWNE